MEIEKSYFYRDPFIFQSLKKIASNYDYDPIIFKLWGFETLLLVLSFSITLILIGHQYYNSAIFVIYI